MKHVTGETAIGSQSGGGAYQRYCSLPPGAIKIKISKFSQMTHLFFDIMLYHPVNHSWIQTSALTVCHVSDRRDRGAVASISFMHSHTAALLSWVHRCSLSTPVNIRVAVTEVPVPPSKGEHSDSAAVKAQSRNVFDCAGSMRWGGCVWTRLRLRFSRTSREVELAPRIITTFLLKSPQWNLPN